MNHDSNPRQAPQCYTGIASIEMDDEFEVGSRYHTIHHSEGNANGNWPTDAQIQANFFSLHKVPSDEGNIIYKYLVRKAAITSR